MSMTRKHFEAIAKILADARDDSSTAQPGTYAAGHADGWEAARRALALDLMLFCEEQNPNFDRERFGEACDLSNAGREFADRVAF